MAFMASKIGVGTMIECYHMAKEPDGMIILRDFINAIKNDPRPSVQTSER